uniref:Leucine-rich repeat-containing N-terminal plant-type domain-containing protein n=1 Tax=Setaria italica TaxID=4555 RepID=K3YLD3_SETIT
MRLVFWPWILLFFTFVASSWSLSSDGQALLALSKNLMLPSSVSSSWSASDATPCTWNGVSCNKRNRVVSLDLSSSKVSGSIGPEIGFLKYLHILYLFCNNIYGSIPPELGNCTVYQHQLDLSENFLSGNIPASMGNLKRLSQLSLYIVH